MTDAPTVPRVECRGVTRRYGDLAAVDSLDLEVRDGEILVALGPSGCGKTTTLRLIAGFEAPDAGAIDIAGVRVAQAERPPVHIPPERRRVGMVFQDYALFPHLSVRDNVAFGVKGEDDPGRRVREVLGLVGLSRLGDRLPAQLSGGQQQRVAMARALAPRPDVLLMDEPFSSLDARLRAQVRDEIREILVASGTAVVFVTHDQDEALFMGDRVAILNAGRLEQVGTPEEIFHSPATRFVAEFMGDTCFIAGCVTRAGIDTVLGTLPQAVPVPTGGEVHVLVRPDDIALHRDALGPARIERRVFRGIQNRYRVALPTGEAVYCLTDHSVRYEPGDPVRVEFDLRHPLVVFSNGEAVSATRS